MAFKDLVNSFKGYFMEDDDDFEEETSRPVQTPKPSAVSSAAKSEEKVAAKPNQGRPVVPPMARQKPQEQRPQQRPLNTRKKTIAEEKKMNVTMTAQQQAATAISTIAIKEPRAYSDIMEAARIVKNGESVLVNFKFMADNQARRSIDFMTGVVFTLGGDIQNVGGQIFLMTPAQVSVDAAREMSVLAGQNFESYDSY